MPPEQKLRDLIVASVHAILDELHGTALFLDLEALSPSHRRAVVARRDLFDRGLRRLLEEGIRLGRFGSSIRSCSRSPSWARSTGFHAGTTQTVPRRLRTSPTGSPTT